MKKMLSAPLAGAILMISFLPVSAQEEPDYNYFVGEDVGRTGRRNIFIGGQAGRYAVGGVYNIFIGYNAGTRNANSEGNVFIGAFCGQNNTLGMYNSFYGSYAGQHNTSGNGNALFGESAGVSNTSGSNNTFMGTLAGADNITATNNTYYGYQSGVQSTGSFNTFLGTQSGYSNISGHHNTFVGQSAGYNNVAGAFNTVLGIYAGPPAGSSLTNSTSLGTRARVTISNAMVLGSTNGVNGATANTNVGIRTTAPTYALHLNAPDAAKVGGGAWQIISDKRLKQDITEFEDGLEVLGEIKPVWFRYNGKAGIQTTKKFVGVIAQDMQKIAPYAVGEFIYHDTSGNKETYLDYDPNSLTYILVNAVKEQQEKINQQDAKIEALEQELADIKDLILSGNTNMNTGAKLWQNQPNPADGSTMIRYFVPEKSRFAQLNIFTMNGKQVHSATITSKGRGQITISPKQFASGTYSYHLMVDGKIVDQKKLVLVR